MHILSSPRSVDGMNLLLYQWSVRTKLHSMRAHADQPVISSKPVEYNDVSEGEEMLRPAIRVQILRLSSIEGVLWPHLRGSSGHGEWLVTSAVKPAIV